MSSAGRDQSGRGDRPRSFTRFIRRASKVIRPKERGSEASETPASTATPPAASSAAAAPGAAATPAAAAKPAQSTARDPVMKTTPKLRRPADTGPEIVRSTPTNSAAHFRHQEQKARDLFAKYNMKLEAGEWGRARGTGDTDWVEKKVRIRVHRQCHRCQTGFGREKICKQCGHGRCADCPRFPDKTLKDRSTKSGAGPVAVDADPKYQAIAKRRQGPVVLTMEGKHGRDLVRRLPVHRVRRTCHKCDTMFVGKATQCENCKHTRCPQCPRDPPKLSKWADGYPGDEEEKFPLAERTYRKPRLRVRWKCHSCDQHFREGEKECRNCQHNRCDDCTRWPPKKVRAEPHPDVVRSLEQKLGRITLTSAA